MNEATARFLPARFFQASLAEADPEIAAAVARELVRQQESKVTACPQALRLLDSIMHRNALEEH